VATPGKSFSGIKGNVIEETEGMRIGKHVHTYLLKPSEYNWEMADVVVPIAKRFVEFLGVHVIRMLDVECAVTADMTWEGLTMKYKGLMDMHLKDVIIIDFKILAGDLNAAIKHFLYDQQLIGYGAPINAKKRLIISYNKKTKLIQTAFIEYDPRWWQYQIKRYGVPV
jgi:hypothetical protein